MALLEAGVCTKSIENGTAKCDTSETSDSLSILDEKIALAVPQIKKKKTQNLHHKFNLLWPRPKVNIQFAHQCCGRICINLNQGWGAGVGGGAGRSRSRLKKKTRSRSRVE